MVEHADLLDTSLLHEPKGIKESTAGDVYVSTVANVVSGPWSGEWRKLKVEDLDLTVQYSTSQEYTPQASPISISSTITAATSGTLTDAVTFLESNKNDQELYLAVVNLRTRLATLESSVSKLEALTKSIDDGLKSLGLFSEEE